jgi:hypothetical protein
MTAASFLIQRSLDESRYGFFSTTSRGRLFPLASPLGAIGALARSPRTSNANE